ncbi:dTDP-4-dehydrorhamnose 3,5-epimerase [Rhodospirillum rubrum]|uniref:dTDP-4-dehydrorhamnose 3,5-epimerase n=1 Tax=Rhodospirillum rubrum (strain ATCC 11170 / ATH 1.1.1 / DSM 467 / LMG 4362 / NCIMB 8255 / S1) TaxID=269796 RepID=Q2RML1_RHORT|nr:dTDP-4-dehydrorhamnose 3,5-epimerase [Rhodospirillum rubrum]ABC24634.1 dTDP-4-dehydrorhamnose 3,5-epimerase [Rhodospirillum rubrum ATCC 11170]MBK5956366.1 dTDP-4-dehydrorhamnose 3,5-epimerase [Rhodospirillum rubrum]QXG82487.1 dTDP-4-dehydrorhamnose 3,5-epimerase [Rhodospirillum rubrum]
MAVEVTHLDIAEVKILRPAKFGDDRGFFSETYNKVALAEVGITLEFIQDNHSFSAKAGTVRGLHFQTPPFAQDKLIRVVRGALFDVAVDLRVGSPTYGQSVSAVISAAAWNQILIPAGFAHGLCTIEPDTEVLYKVSAPYSPDHDKGLLWNDPALGIEWPVSPGAAILSDKDARQPVLADLPAYFTYP